MTSDVTRAPGSPRTGVLAALVPAALVLAVALSPLGPASAHEGIESSDPASGSQLEAPISHAEIDFGEVIADDLELALLYDVGDSNIEQVDGTVSKTGPTSGRIDFDPLEREGRYFVRYLVTVPLDGHVVAGAIVFDYGEAGGGGSGPMIWVAFGIVAVGILGIGSWFTRRRHLATTAGPGDDETADDEEAATID